MLKPKAIKNLRESLRLTQEEFAQKFEVSRITVARWESGERVPEKKYEPIFEELRTKDNWPSCVFFADVVGPLAGHAGSAPIKRLKKQHDIPNRALLSVAETFIHASESHPERYVEISKKMDEGLDLLHSVYNHGLLPEGSKLHERVKEFLFASYQPQAL